MKPHTIFKKLLLPKKVTSLLLLSTLIMAYKQRFISNDFETSQIFEKIKQNYTNFRKN